jgi:hypothetical protein
MRVQELPPDPRKPPPRRRRRRSPGASAVKASLDMDASLPPPSSPRFAAAGSSGCGCNAAAAAAARPVSNHLLFLVGLPAPTPSTPRPPTPPPPTQRWTLLRRNKITVMRIAAAACSWACFLTRPARTGPEPDNILLLVRSWFIRCLPLFISQRHKRFALTSKGNIMQFGLNERAVHQVLGSHYLVFGSHYLSSPLWSWFAYSIKKWRFGLGKANQGKPCKRFEWVYTDWPPGDPHTLRA